MWKHVYTYFLWCIFSAILQRVCWQFPGTWFASITIYFFPSPRSLFYLSEKETRSRKSLLISLCLFCVLFFLLLFFVLCTSFRIIWGSESIQLLFGTCCCCCWNTYAANICCTHTHTHIVYIDWTICANRRAQPAAAATRASSALRRIFARRIVFCLLFYSLFQHNKQSLQKGGGAGGPAWLDCDYRQSLNL